MATQPAIDLEPLYATRPEWARMADCPFCRAGAASFNISVSYSTDLKGNLANYFGECAECGTTGPLADSPTDALERWDACREQVSA